jgi:NADPH-dependent 2,4-dienoyl-CoA reductase/sulfur reductase-like enzyme
MEIVIVGSGPAGLQAALLCRRCWPQKSVTLIEGEGTIGYCRPMLPQFMAGQVEEEKLFYLKPEEDPLLKVRTGVKVQSLNRETQTLHLESREKIDYERLVLAPGGRPIIPRIDGLDSLQGIFPVRNLPEARKVREWINKDRQIIVLGGGLVGVKTAAYLRVSGFQISLVEKEDHLLPQALKGHAARVVEDHLRRIGIRLFLGQTLKYVEGKNGILEGVNLDGKGIPCEAVLVAVGSVPNVAFLESSGLLEEGRLLVSPALQTRDARIFAAGDAITISTSEGKKLTPWTWPQAVSQGKLVGENLYRPNPVALKVLTRTNSMNLQGLSLAMLGAQVEGSEEISYGCPAAGSFRQVFLFDGRMIGGALLGDVSAAGPLHHLMFNGREAGSEVNKLIKPLLQAIPPNPLVYGKRGKRARFFLTKEDKKQC